MERFAFMISLRPGTEHLYDEAHDAMTDELYDVYRSAGLRNWTMFRLGTQVVGYVECAGDVRAALDVVAANPLEQAFDAALAEVFVDARHPDFGMREMVEVWHSRD